MKASEIRAAAEAAHKQGYQDERWEGGFEAGARWAQEQNLKHCPMTYEPKHGGPEVEYLEYREFKQLCEIEED